MKKLLLALLLIPAIGWGQDFKHRYFHFNQYFDAPTPFLIVSTDADGADSHLFSLGAGGAATRGRGAFIDLYGNEHAGNGALGLNAGEDSSNGAITFATGAGVNRVTIPYMADADDVDLVLGASSTTAPVFTIRGQTADADDDGTLCLTGGGACTDIRSSYIKLYGNEVTTYAGDLLLQAGRGTGSSGAIILSTADVSVGSIARVTVPVPAGDDADNVDILLGNASTTAPVFTIRGQTADADDDGTLYLSAGGDTVGTTRGAYLKLLGDDVGGAGAGGGITYEAGTGTLQAHNFSLAGTTAFAISGSAKDSVYKWGTSTDQTETFSLSSNAVDGKDKGFIAISAGGAISSSARGAGIQLYGNEHGGAGAMTFFAGNAAGNGSITFETQNLSRWGIEYDGDLANNATSGGNLVFQRDLYGIIDSTDAPAAAGTGAASTDATELTAVVTFVTGADASKGVKFPATPIGGQRYVIYNTANAVLKVWPGAGDQINAAGADTAVPVAAYGALYCHASSASQIWCGEMANAAL